MFHGLCPQRRHKQAQGSQDPVNRRSYTGTQCGTRCHTQRSVSVRSEQVLYKTKSQTGCSPARTFASQPPGSRIRQVLLYQPGGMAYLIVATHGIVSAYGMGCAGGLVAPRSHAGSLGRDIGFDRQGDPMNQFRTHAVARRRNDESPPRQVRHGTFTGASGFNDSHLVTPGWAWAHGDWYIYPDLAFSNANEAEPGGPGATHV